MEIRLENENDYLEVEELVRDSFWNVYRPGAFEHYIVHHLRDDESLIRSLAYVVEKDNKIIGHINYSTGFIDYGERKSMLWYWVRFQLIKSIKIRVSDQN